MDKFIYYSVFREIRPVQAFTTTRAAFPGQHVRFTGDAEGDWQVNRHRLADLLGIAAGHLIFPRQEHTAQVVDIPSIPCQGLDGVDALITNQPGICLCVQTADCVPVLLYDPVKRVVAAIHAGWRGTANLIVQKTVQQMVRLYQSDPAQLIAVIGPSIGPEVYEVGGEVAGEIMRSVPRGADALHSVGHGKYLLNLWEANRQVLIASGLTSGRIEVFGECTWQHREKYFSARREGITTGRIVSGIMIRTN